MKPALQNHKTPAVSLSLEEAKSIIKSETAKLRIRHVELYNAYHEHKKALAALIEVEPEKPLLLGLKKWKQDYACWNTKKDALTKTLMDDLTSLGCVMDNPKRMEEDGAPASILSGRNAEGGCGVSPGGRKHDPRGRAP
jgi:hypothetical protein